MTTSLSFRLLGTRALAVLGAFALLLPLSIGVAGPAAAAPTAASGPVTAPQQFGACLAGGKPGDLLLLVDQSGSLSQTDPDAVRVKAATYLLNQLANSPTASKASLDIAVSGFDVNYQKVVDWQRLTPAAVPGLQTQVQQFADRKNGFDTDYVTALDGARSELRARNPAGDRCQAVLWFTDGQFDVDPRTTADQRDRFGDSKNYAPGVRLTDEAAAQRVLGQGQTSLCRPGGIADQLRASGVLTFGIALGSDAGKFELMQAIATGRGGEGTACGRPTSATVGDFRRAKDVDDLLFEFDALGDLSQKPKQTKSGVCAGKPCEELHRFVLDGSVGQAHVLAGSSEPGVQIQLTAPNGGGTATFSYPDNTAPQLQKLAGQDVRAQWLSDRSLDLTLRRGDPKGWTGQWSVVFVDPASRPGGRARTQIRITGDLAPAVAPGAPALRSGEQPTVPVQLKSETTNRVVSASDILGTASVSAELRPASGPPVPVANDVPVRDLARGFRIDLGGVAPGTASLRLTLKLTTADVSPTVKGTPLDDRVVDVPVSVLPPVNYPSVAPRVDLGRSEGTKPLTGKLKVTGPGCVWVDGATVDASPDGVGAVTASVTSHATPADCLRLDPGATGEIPLALRVEHPGNGTLAGTLQAHLQSADAGSRPITAPVAFVGDVTKPRSALFLPGFLLALLIGIGLPIGLLYLAKWHASRIPAAALRVGLFPVSVSRSAVRRGDQPFSVTADELRFLSVPNATRSVPLGGGLTLRARTGVSPTAVGYAQVEAPGRVAMTGARSGATDRLPLANSDTWVALVRADRPPAAEVLVLISGDTMADGEILPRISNEVSTQLPRLMAQVADGQPPSGGSAAPFDGAQPDPTGQGPFAGAGQPVGGSGGAGPFGGAPAGNPGAGAPFGGGPFGGGPFGGGPGGAGPFGGNSGTTDHYSQNTPPGSGALGGWQPTSGDSS